MTRSTVPVFGSIRTIRPFKTFGDPGNVLISYSTDARVQSSFGISGHSDFGSGLVSLVSPSTLPKGPFTADSSLNLGLSLISNSGSSSPFTDEYESGFLVRTPIE